MALPTLGALGKIKMSPYVSNKIIAKKKTFWLLLFSEVTNYKIN